MLDAPHYGSASADEKNQFLKTLVEAAQADDTEADCALTLMFLTLWPGLDAVYRRSRWRGAGSDGELSSEMLIRAIEAIGGLYLNRVNRIAATILQNIERDLSWARRREVASQNLHVANDLGDVEADPIAAEPKVSPEWLLRDLVRVVGADTTLVMRVAVAGNSQAETATELGLTAVAARKRYQRALRRAREALSAAA